MQKINIFNLTVQYLKSIVAQYNSWRRGAGKHARIFESSRLEGSYMGTYWTAAAAAKSLQSCPTLCNPVDCSMPGFPVLHCLPEFAQIGDERIV